MIIFTSTVGCCLVFLCYMHIVFVFFFNLLLCSGLTTGSCPRKGGSNNGDMSIQSGVPGFHM